MPSAISYDTRMQELTPMMRQYHEIKSQHRDKVLFFRLGDFYEMFDTDAIEVSKLLNLTLTQRTGAPMCGIPYHSAGPYLKRLLDLGKRIAICEQVSVPGAEKGIVARKVVDVLTPGSVVEETLLGNSNSNHTMALHFVENRCAIAVADLSTGQFLTTSFRLDDAENLLFRELDRYQPREILMAEEIAHAYPILSSIGKLYSKSVQTSLPAWYFDAKIATKKVLTQFRVQSLTALGLHEQSLEIVASGVLLEYWSQNAAGSELSHIRHLEVYHLTDFLSLDESTARNLELTSNLRDQTTSFTLFEVLNQTKTAVGARLLKNRLLFPLKNELELNRRLDALEVFLARSELMSQTRSILAQFLDLDRLCARLSLDKATPRDLLGVENSLRQTLELLDLFSAQKISVRWKKILEKDEIEELRNDVGVISQCLLREPSVTINEGQLIQDGWNSELDQLRNLKNHSQDVLDRYVEEEKQRSNLPFLKLKYNRIIGYFFEIPRSKQDQLPDHFLRKQSLLGAERYSTVDLKKLEDDLLGAQDRIVQLERSIFLELRGRLKQRIDGYKRAGEWVAEVDVTQSLAFVSARQGFVRPELHSGRELEIVDGRHPVVEASMIDQAFVPNSVRFGDGDTLFLLTGPNMAGKSTYLRQTALIVLMAQIGAYVPARNAKIALVDKIFCRVGASDYLAKGESTFLVEMNETALILRSASERSLVIMDEVGRGTSTQDGFSIAWAICEYLLETVKAKTLFATHFHELTDLQHPALKNFSMSVVEDGANVVFLRKVVEGASDNSYGIYVAQLAGIPIPVVTRAQQILSHLTKSTLEALPVQTQTPQPGLFSEDDLIRSEILSISVEKMTPLEALVKLDSLQKKLKSSL